ncbi:hypothetical protein SSP24_06450 [Streptomyces spinoverrucosus]|uniref:Uncharacterized protein n=1 Tax=Streptomyces spinoverrucosus TaxID=284043 RepID=A0A4Y3VAZ6_9ACTN|nr:hypothetical protein [Streptomyces spinoverrucosus]GEC02990.1 hypothetical protein SSP24_06450 [Streptomyces spinoverrucosus]GHB39036.1 hypothetical protein GCM10010397_06140 [Streptomyces spinoverrucosus]
MNASSQTPPGALPTETSSPPLQAAFATFGVALPVPAGSPAAPAPVSPDASPAEAVTAVVAAEMAKDKPVTPRDIATAEMEAGIVFDPARFKMAVDAAREQARAEYSAELAERGDQLAVMTDFKHRLDRVMRAIEGRPDNDTMLVREILAAVHGTAPYADVPMTLAWTRSVDVPEQGAEDQRAVVDCVTAHGGRAHLVLTRDERQALASLLDAEIVRDIHAPCPHSKACGLTDDEIDAAYPKLFGWSRVFIVGLDEPGRWYCTPACVSRALARAGEKLAEADNRAELDGGL